MADVFLNPPQWNRTNYWVAWGCVYGGMWGGELVRDREGSKFQRRWSSGTQGGGTEHKHEQDFDLNFEHPRISTGSPTL